MFSGLNMKMKNHGLKLILIITFISFITSISFGQQNYMLSLEKSSNPNFYEMQKAINSYWEQIPESERKGWKNFKRWESFWERRVYPTGEFPDAAKILKDWQQTQMKNKINVIQSVSEWNLLGPIDNPASISGTRDQGLGRINRIRFQSDNDNIIWAGSAAGGVWKSVDGGKNWCSSPFHTIPVHRSIRYCNSREKSEYCICSNRRLRTILFQLLFYWIDKNHKWRN